MKTVQSETTNVSLQVTEKGIMIVKSTLNPKPQPVKKPSIPTHVFRAKVPSVYISRQVKAETAANRDISVTLKTVESAYHSMSYLV